MDYMAQEQERGITITSAATTCFWGLETDADRQGAACRRTESTSSTRLAMSTSQSKSSARMRVLDGVVALFDAVAGVQPQSETVWRQATRYKVPRMCFVNKMDRTGADFFRAVGTITERLGAPRPPADSDRRGDGVQGRRRPRHDEGDVYETEDKGRKLRRSPTSRPICLSLANEYREKMIEKVAECDEALIEKYLEGEAITVRTRSTRRSARARSRLKIVPVLWAPLTRTRAFSRCSTL